jgi:hypothetical protein
LGHFEVNLTPHFIKPYQNPKEKHLEKFLMDTLAKI